MSRLRLTLVDGHRVNPTVWTPESKWCQQHPVWPGGHYQHELVWAYAEDGTTRPTWILLPHPTQNNRYILCNNYTSHQYGARQGEQFTLLTPLPKIFFYEAHRRHPDRLLTTPSSLLKYAIPCDADKPYLPQLYERLPEAAPATPRKLPPDEQGDPLPPPEALAPAKVEEVPEDIRQNWHTALKSFLKEYQSYPINQNFEVNPSLLAALSCYWPLVRMTLNAKGAINRFRVSLRRVYYNEKLLGASDNNALRTARDQANELKLMALTPSTVPREPLRYAARTSICNFGHRVGTPLINRVLVALLSESCRFNGKLAKAADANDETKYQSRGVVNMQAITDVSNPALTTLPLQQVHIYFPVGFLDVVLPKLTSSPYMMNMRRAPADSLNLAQTENHYITLPDARMPHTPVCNEMYKAGLMNPSRADRIWYTHRCNLKLAVTMFKPAELECCLNSLSARRLVVSAVFLNCTNNLATDRCVNGNGHCCPATTKQRGRHTFHPRSRKCLAH